MTAQGFDQLGERSIYRGHMIHLVEATVSVPDGSEVLREVVRHPGAVAIVALDAESCVVFERQYRAALDNNLLEIPAGKRDVPDEPPLETAKRELLEETGLSAARWTELTEFYNSPGFSDEHSTIFLAEDLTDLGHDLQGPEEEAMVIERVPIGEVWNLISGGQLVDGKSIVGLVVALHHLETRA